MDDADLLVTLLAVFEDPCAVEDLRDTGSQSLDPVGAVGLMSRPLAVQIEPVCRVGANGQSVPPAAAHVGECVGDDGLVDAGEDREALAVQEKEGAGEGGIGGLG